MKKSGPKAYQENISLIDKPIGNAERAEYMHTIFKDAPIFPKPLEYSDIDSAFFDFVKEKIPLTADGIEVPTFTIYSSQRFSEYSQTWKHTDADNNLLMNFKTVSRENNPKVGDNQGGFWNIPGDRRYTLLMRTVLEDDGKEVYEIYSMKQPFAVDLSYKVSFITNKMENINSFNLCLNDLFKARQHYIRPNGHFVPLVIDEINDETQYSIEERKFYVQSATIKAMAYIIDKSSFRVDKKPKGLSIHLESGMVKKKPKVDVNIEEYNSDNLEHTALELTVSFKPYHQRVNFTMDGDAVIETTEKENIRTIRLHINKVPIYFEKGFKLKDGDEVRIKIVPYKLDEPCYIKFVGYNPNQTYIEGDVPEFVSDEVEKFEEIEVK